MGCNGSCPAVEQVSEGFLDAFAIHLSLLRQKQTGSRFDLSPCQSAAPVFGSSDIAAEEAHPC